MSTPPIFLLGAPRSGTTLLSLMLDGNSQIAIPYESHFIPDYYRRRERLGDFCDSQQRQTIVASILAQPYVREWDQSLTLEDIELERCVDLSSTIAAVFSAYARLSGKPRWGDKTPGYTDQAHILNALFPDARFVHLIRDGRDVAVSHAQQTWGPADWPTALAHWRTMVDCARRMLHMLPAERHLELRFEELIAAPSERIRELCSFLEVPFEPAMLDAPQTTASRKVGARIEQQHAKLQGLPSPAEVAKWSRSFSGAEQALAWEIAGPFLVELGYDAGRRRHPGRLWKKIEFSARRGLRRRWKRWRRNRST